MPDRGLSPGARVLRFGAGTTDTALLDGGGILFGWSFRETTGAAAATVVLRDGSRVDAPAVVSISLISAESTRDIWGYPGIALERGLFVDVTSGSVEGAIYVLCPWMIPEYCP